MLESPKDISATTQPETAIVNCIKSLCIGLHLNIIWLRLIFSRNPVTGGQIKWVISSQVCSRVRKRVGFARKKSKSESLSSITIEGKRIAKTSVFFAKKNGSRPIIKRTWMQIASYTGRGLKSTEKKTARNTMRKTGALKKFIEKETVSLSMRPTVMSALVAEKKSRFFSLLTTSTMTATLSENPENTRVAHSFIVTLLNGTSRPIIRFFVTTVIWAGLEIMVFALIKKVQRLSGNRVRPSGRKCLLPLKRGNDIVPTAWKHAAAA